MASSTTVLTTNDSFVLSAVFDPESIGASSAHASLINSRLPAGLPYINSALLPALQDAEKSIILSLNTADNSISQIETALSNINMLISSNPNYASAYNNRAQILRLLHGNDLFAKNVQESTIWSDLEQAIKLATPQKSEVGIKVCLLQGDVLAAAHMQRAYLLLKAARQFEVSSKAPGNSLQILRGSDKVGLEERACRDFELASRYGDEDAGKMAKSLNPYAKLCGSVVAEAMKAELEKLEK